MNYSGTVKKSRGRGKKMGFPTANIEVASDAPEGIFVAWTTINDESYPSLFFIGSAKTFGERKKWGEAYLLDFGGELYGIEIHVKILEKLRESRGFDSEEELVKEMERDEERAREYFANLEK
jgi:riboflavin kinase/FMN adenylyltransferase